MLDSSFPPITLDRQKALYGILAPHLREYEKAKNSGFKEILLSARQARNDSWRQLEARNYWQAVLIAEAGLLSQDFGNDYEWLYSHQALGLLLGGEFEAAKRIYLSKKDDSFKDPDYPYETFRETFLGDIEELEAGGITHPGFDKVKALLKEEVLE